MFTSRYRHGRRHGYGHSGMRRRRPRRSFFSNLRRYSDPIVGGRSRPFRFFRYGPPLRRARPWERDNSILPKPEDESPEPMDVDVAPEVPEAPTEELAKLLHVENIDLHIPANIEAHKTDRYVITESRLDVNTGLMVGPELVVRRGQDINISIEFDRPFHKNKNDLELVFKTGKTPRPNTKTLVNLKVDESGKANEDPFQWHARLEKKHGNTLDISVYSAADAVIGEWEFSVKTSEQVESSEVVEKLRYDHPDEIYLILNPWCKDDTCYMSTTELLDEYVLNDSGAIYSGNSYQLAAKPWNFGQFEEVSLDAAFHLLRKAFGGDANISMSDIVEISRAFSKMVNSPNNNGVLEGNWSGEYEGGTKPTAWIGSTKILQEYMKTKQPVKYGQCWVFSGVTTTVCRAIGLPCRSVTNFSSAHDTDGSVTIDKYMLRDASGETHDISRDSIWNFHVWNEIWTTRPDLVEGYDGWQVIDATPQELSGGVYCCGPSPVSAIKKGEITVPYESPFIFAEVNADRVHWEVNEMDEYKIVSIETDTVGVNISTKVANGKPYRGLLGAWLSRYGRREDKDREDITHLYKFPEGSVEERQAVLTANKASKSERDVYALLKKQDIKVELEEQDDIMIGDDFDFNFKIYNVNQFEGRTVTFEVIIKGTSYHGRTTGIILKKKWDKKTLKPTEEFKYTVGVTMKDYFDKLTEHTGMEVYLSALVDETAQIFARTHNFRLRRPELTVEAPDEGKVGEEVEVILHFTNPLPIPLTECTLDVEAPGMETLTDQPHKDVPPKAKFEAKMKLKPTRSSYRSIIGNFDAKELSDITGYKYIFIKKGN